MLIIKMQLMHKLNLLRFITKLNPRGSERNPDNKLIILLNCSFGKLTKQERKK